MFAKGEIHCEYCQCPVEIWKPVLKTYKGHECRLYDDFSNVIFELGELSTHFNNQDIITRCRLSFENQYTDIENVESTINEMIDIYLELGVMPDNYRPLYIIQKG